MPASPGERGQPPTPAPAGTRGLTRSQATAHQAQGPVGPERGHGILHGPWPSLFLVPLEPDSLLPVPSTRPKIQTS